jgi:hypothetical protein
MCGAQSVEANTMKPIVVVFIKAWWVSRFLFMGASLLEQDVG